MARTSSDGSPVSRSPRGSASGLGSRRSTASEPRIGDGFTSDIVTRPITSYTAYECTWGYAPNREHGQIVRVLDVGERDLPGGLPSSVLDDGGSSPTVTERSMSC